jgi:hypothetical protein
MKPGSIVSGGVMMVLAGFAVFGASAEVLAHDVSYYLYVSREVLAGALPFRDYIDPNLPTIIYLGVPIALVSDWTDIPIWTCFQAFVVALEVASLGVSAWLLRTRLLRDDDDLFWVVLAVLLTALCLVPMGLVGVDSSHFGQREHLTLLFVTPYVLWHAVRARGGRISPRAALAVAAFASIGIAIKPHFLLFWALLEGWSALRERGSWPRAALLPPVAFGLYFALLLATLPEFPTMILYTWQLYGAYKDRAPLEILRLAPVALPLAILLLHRLLPVAERLRALRSALGVAALAWWLIGIMQQRGFPYHFAPAVSLSIVLGLVSAIGTGPGRRGIPLVYALLVFLGFGSVEIAWRDRYGQDVHLEKVFRERAPGGAVLVLSTNVWPSFPAALYADTRWSSRFPALWFLPGLYEDVPPASPFAYRSLDEMGELERWHLDAVIDDFEREPPQVVLVDRYRFQPGFGETNFDYLAYFSQSPRFRTLWCPYRKTDLWQEVFTLYERDPKKECRGSRRGGRS